MIMFIKAHAIAFYEMKKNSSCYMSYMWYTEIFYNPTYSWLCSDSIVICIHNYHYNTKYELRRTRYSNNISIVYRV